MLPRPRPLAVPQEYMRKYGDPAKVEAVLERVRMELAVYEASPTGGPARGQQQGGAVGRRKCGWRGMVGGG
jgi:hypothetical protein